MSTLNAPATGGTGGGSGGGAGGAGSGGGGGWGGRGQPSEQRFRAIFEQAAVGVAQVAPDGRWLDVNQRLCTIVGYTRAELLAGSFQDITHPDDLDADLDHVRAVLAGEISTYAMEKRYFCKGGTVTWVNLTVSLVRGDTGEPLYFISVVEDINDRKRAEQRLAESERRFRAIFEQAAVGVAQVAPDGSWMDANPRMCAIVGYTREEFLTTSYQAMTHPDDLEADRALVARIFAGEIDTYAREKRYIRKDGTAVWVHLAASVVRGPGGEVLYGVDVVQDIDDRKRAEQRLAESERRFRTLVEGTDVVVWEADPLTQRFTYVSPQAARFGYPIDEWYTPGFWAGHIHPDDREEVVAFCTRESAAARNHNFQYRMLAADGRTVWIRDIVQVEMCSGGKDVVLLRGVLVDITESKRQEELARTVAEREVVATIAAGVAHEFNSLLLATSIHMHQHADVCQVPGDETCAKAGELVKQAQGLAAAILDLFLMGPGTGDSEAIALTSWLPETVERLAATLARGVGVTTVVEPGVPDAMAHALGLEQVIRNILVNATHAMGERGNIRVSAGAGAGAGGGAGAGAGGSGGVGDGP